MLSGHKIDQLTVTLPCHLLITTTMNRFFLYINLSYHRVLQLLRQWIFNAQIFFLFFITLHQSRHHL